MTERAQEFYSLSDAEKGRPNLDRACAVHLEQFAGLVAKYSFRVEERVTCQLWSKTATCKQIHGLGWIARCKDGKEGFIGKDCAQRNFGADSSFKSERSRITKELRIDGLIARIEALTSGGTSAERLAAAFERQRILKSRIDKERAEWPMPLIQRIDAMAKSGNGSVSIAVHYIETDEKGNTNRTDVSVRLGEISSPRALDLERVRSVFKRLSESRKAYAEAIPSREESERKLKAWIDAMELVDQCELDLEGISADLNRFLSPTSLNLLCWCVRQQDAQEATIKRALGFIENRAVSDSEAARIRRDRAQAIRTDNAGRDFHVEA